MTGYYFLAGAISGLIYLIFLFITKNISEIELNLNRTFSKLLSNNKSSIQKLLFYLLPIIAGGVFGIIYNMLWDNYGRDLINTLIFATIHTIAILLFIPVFNKAIKLNQKITIKNIFGEFVDHYFFAFVLYYITLLFI